MPCQAECPLVLTTNQKARFLEQASALFEKDKIGAFDCFRAASLRWPESADIWFGLAQCSQAVGKPSVAWEALEAAKVLAPVPPVLLAWADHCTTHSSCVPAAALQAYEEVMAAPGQYQAACNRAFLLAKTEPAAAPAAYRLCFARTPAPPYPEESFYVASYGQVLWQQHECAELLALVTPLLPRPSRDRPTLLRLAGFCEARARRLPAAIALLEESLALEPHLETEFELGKALALAHREVEALPHLAAAAAEQPSVPTLHALGLVQRAVKQTAASARTLEAVVALAPGSNSARLDLAVALKELCLWARADAVLALLPPAELHPFFAMLLGRSPGEIRALAEARAAAVRAEAAAEALVPVRPPAAVSPGEAGLLRVGFVSSNFLEHAQGSQVGHGFFAAMRAHAAVFLYSTRPSEHEAVGRIRSQVEHWADLAPLTDAAAAARVRADRLDLLLDMAGFVDEARPGVLAHRPAPLLVNYLGYPGTLGGLADYHVCDPRACPAPAEFSEALLLLPTYQLMEHANAYPDDPAPLPPALLAEPPLPTDALVLANFNGAIKLDTVVFGLWLQVLRAVPASVLWLLSLPADAAPALRAAAAAGGVAPTRLHFAPRVDKRLHHRRLARAALVLDTHAYSGHTSAADALWAGVPVLCWPGPAMPGRVCASLLAAAGLPELVVHSAEAYVQTAVALASDPPRLAALRQRLLAARANPMWNVSESAAGLAALLRAAHHRRLAGFAPAPIALQDLQEGQGQGQGQHKPEL